MNIANSATGAGSSQIVEARNTLDAWGTEDYPREVKWISMRLKASGRTKLPEELLTEQDVQALIRAV